jgi:hypothetical protein
MEKVAALESHNRTVDEIVRYEIVYQPPVEPYTGEDDEMD